MSDVFILWSYLSQQPLLWLTATLAAYWVGDRCFAASGRQSWANPVLIAMILLGTLLLTSGTSYATYFEGAQFVHFMLGPATVALALPLYDNLAEVRRAALPILAALVVGALVSVVAALAVGKLFGFDAELLATLAPKAATSPVAIGVSEQLGGLPTLTAALVLMTGVFGAIIATPLLRLIRMRDQRAGGFALGVAAHGIGTARAFQVSERAGSFAGIGMGLSAIATSIIAPLVLRFFL